MGNLHEHSYSISEDHFLEKGAALQSGSPMTGRSDLIQIIESEIIPRLFLAHRDRVPRQAAVSSCEAGELGDCAFLADLFIRGKSVDIVKRLQALLHRGMRRERIYLELLAPVPKTLSLFWSEGQYDFDQIADGLRCFDDVLRQLHEREQVEN